MKIMFSPDEVLSNGSEIPVKPPTRQPYLPKAVDDLLTTAANVSTTWAQNPLIKLLFITQVEFNAKVDTLGAKLNARKEAGKYRPGQTNTLDTMDQAIDAGVSAVKRYFEDKYETDDATPYFSIVGIEHKGSRWMFPQDRDKRRDALKTMVAGIASEGFGNRKSGTAFWDQMSKDYDKALQEAQSTDQSVSAAVGELSQLEENIRFALQGLLFVLRGNYQTTYQQVYKAWGFRK